MKYSIFISSVQTEFEAEREMLQTFIETDELLKAFFSCFVFERTVAADRTPRELYSEAIDQSHIYLVLLGKRYGFEDQEGISATEREYDYATVKRLERWAYLHGNSKTEREPKEQAFIQKVVSAISRKRFSAAEELKKEVYNSCVNFLKRKGKIQITAFDQSVSTNATLADLNPALVTEFISKAKVKRNFPLNTSTPLKDVLTHLNLFRDNQIVNSALLLFADHPQQYFPSATIKCASFHANVVEKPIPDFKEYKGTVYHQIEKAIDFVLSKISVSTGTRAQANEVDTNYEIPRAVIAEAIINAVAHRDYSSNASIQVSVFKNRIEISNPGSLPKELDIDALKKSHQSYPYNLNLADCLFQTGTIERYGTGTLEIYRLSEKQGLHAPIYSQDEGVKVVLWRSSETIQDSFVKNSEDIRNEFGAISEKISENVDKNFQVLDDNYEVFIETIARKNKIASDELRTNFGESSEEFRRKFGDKKSLLLLLIALNPTISAKEASEKIGVSDRTVETYLSQLKKSVLERIGPDKGGYWKIVKK